MEITNDDIKKAERVLLKEGQNFDKERIKFIKNLVTVDLQAVPGSGKTTALLAKLLILGQKVDYSKGRGILVLSHTNTAVNEIKNRLQPHCPELFEYPNFVGTIQSFVDKFLAQPFYTKKYGGKIRNIDDDWFSSKLKSKYSSLQNSTKNFIRNKNCSFSDLKYDINENIIYPLDNGDVKILVKKENNSQVFQEISQIFTDINKDGVIHYLQAYIFANQFISESSKITDLIKLRFQYVFVDEFQDMEKHQHDLLEKLFTNRESDEGIYQRVGDPNQAIYSGMGGKPVKWEVRGSLELTGSNRFGKEIANIVNLFSVNSDGFEIEGKNTDSKTKPILIEYDNPNQVLPKFCELIQKYKNEGKVPLDGDNFWAISRVMKQPDGDNKDKLNITQYFPAYSREQSKTTYKEHYSYFSDYLTYFDKTKSTLESVRKAILNAIIKILDIQDYKNEYGGKITKKQFINSLKECDYALHDDFKSKLYIWSKDLFKGNKPPKDIQDEIVGFLKNNCDVILGKPFDVNHEVSNNFLQVEAPQEKIEQKEISNVYITNPDSKIKVNLGTIHSVKGQTHTATLYLNVWSNSRTCTQSINDIFNIKQNQNCSQDLFQELSPEPTTQDKFSSKPTEEKIAKLLYVAFSRPSHLLCFAVSKSEKNNLPKSLVDFFSVEYCTSAPKP